MDGVVALTHGSGCAMAEGSASYRMFQRVMNGYLQHPNFGAILLVGLGCEVFHVEQLLKSSGLTQGPACRAMAIQHAGGTRRTVEEGVRLVREMLPHANRSMRTTASAEHLVIGLKCGGSDGYSGITANPALGFATDELVRHGGTAILSETPEIYGAEHLLVERSVNRAVAQKLLARIEWWKSYTSQNESTMDDNPAPGNKDGGLTTIVEKSLGALAKGGTSNLVDVYEYAEPAAAKGLVFMDSPGYDPMAVTDQVASGATLVCFTTGRGTVAGFKPTPALKLATSTPMYRRLADDMDINCGEVADGVCSIEEMGNRIFQAILSAASGRPTKSEELGFGDNEFVPWQVGAVM